ncbi:MAG: hypothetical protein Q7R51_03295 [bacterium]|nr:hypothetical protein [bacterium]
MDISAALPVFFKDLGFSDKEIKKIIYKRQKVDNLDKQEDKKGVKG